MKGGLYNPLKPNQTNPLYNPNYVPEQMVVSGVNEPYRGQPTGVPTGLENSRVTGGGAQKVNPSLVRNPFNGGVGGGMSPYGEPLPLTGYSQSPAPFMTQSMLPTRMTQQQMLQATNGGTAVQPQLRLGANTPIPVNNGIPQNSTINSSQNSGASSTSPTLPAGYTYGSDAALDAEQRKLWNIQAGGTGNEQVRLLSKQDVWNRKANSRRRQQSKGDEGQTNNGYVAPEVISTPSGNAVNTSLSWRVG